MEEILIKTFRSGTTIDYFSTLLDERYSSDVVPAYVTFDNANQPTSLHTFDGVSLWARNSENYFVPLSTVTTNYITGQTFSQTTDVELLPYEIEKIKKKFIASANSLYSGQTISYVFSSNHLVDDVFTTVKITKTTDTLDTLSVYNELQNATPIQEGTTGVIFGRLEAIQKVKNRNGDSTRIPLREVPIGIFASDDMFPAATSFDENGDRLTLNYKETADFNYYNNQKSYDMDLKYYLRTSTGLTEMPNHLRYVTKTNKNGEFVIYDVPVGTQTLMFDVNLLSQNLTKDEVALNRFPYPGSTDSNVDYIPHFFFQQVPVDVVPSWGPNQSGYTEVNISANLDLRKWATYYVTPISFRDKTIDSADMLAAGISAPLKISMRDMSKEGYPTSNIPVVEIQEMLDRDTEQSLEWRNEFAQLKDSATFQSHDFHAFKVPANIYDPLGNNSREMDKIEAANGNYESLPGVWLAAYQFRMSFLNKNIFRDTGLDRTYGNNGGTISNITRSHYNLNRGFTDQNSSNNDTVGFMEHFYPYESPWTDIYPEPYSIPRQPKVINTAKTIDGNGNYQGDVKIPKYLDGDMVGFYDGQLKSGGYGSQFYYTSNQWISNRFAKRVTKDLVYKYEDGNSWLERYANDYKPYDPGDAHYGVSKVLNGETFQRVEAGYAYWLRPEGWSNVQCYSPTHDGIISSTLPPFPVNAPANGGTNGNLFMAPQQDLTLKMDPTMSDSEGALEIYRIVNPDPEKLVSPDPEVIITKARFVFWRIYRRKGKTGGPLRLFWVNQGDQGGDQDDCYRFGHQGSANFYFNSMLLKIRNTGEEKTNYRVLLGGVEMQFDSIDIGATVEVPLTAGDHTNELVIELEGNANFDFNNFKFLNAKCEMNFSHFDQGSGVSPDFSPDENYSFATNFTTDVNPINYFLLTDLNHVVTNITQNIKGNRSCSGRVSSKRRDIRHWGFIFGCEAGSTDWVGSWWSTNLGSICAGHCCTNEYQRINQVLWAIPCSER